MRCLVASLKHISASPQFCRTLTEQVALIPVWHPAALGALVTVAPLPWMLPAPACLWKCREPLCRPTVQVEEEVKKPGAAAAAAAASYEEEMTSGIQVRLPCLGRGGGSMFCRVHGKVWCTLDGPRVVLGRRCWWTC
jgi:hypothetical protein